MKIWLDDQYENRKGWFPDDWVHCRWPEDVIKYLEMGIVEEVSLDHDLDDADNKPERTGYDVLTWIEEQVSTSDYVPPKLKVHSANPAGKGRMLAAINQIQKIIDNRGG